MSDAAPLHILLAEDDDDVRLTTRLVLLKQGFTVTETADGEEAWAAFRSAEQHNTPFDAAVLDVMMPGIDGLTLTKKIREVSNLPVILLTARDLPIDQVTGLEAGGDDYVTKPFNSDVLRARINAVVRRAQAHQKPQTATEVIRVGDVDVDLKGMTVTKDGHDVDLTATEFKLLSTFLDHHGQVLSREELLAQVWGGTVGFEHRIVDVNIQRLRTKIGADVIVTVRGAGYKLLRNP